MRSKQSMSGTIVLCALIAISTPFAGATAQLTLDAANAAIDNGPRATPQVAVAGYAVATPNIFFDFTANPYALLSGNLKFSEDKTKQKVNFAFLRLRRDASACGWSCETVLNLVKTDNDATFGLSSGYNSGALYSGRMKSILTKQTSAKCRSQQPNENEDTYKKTVLYPCVIGGTFEQLAKRAYSLSVGGNIQTFGVFGGTKLDKDSDGKIDNAKSLKGMNVNISGTFSPNIQSLISFSGQFTRQRAAATEGEELASYPGASLGAQLLLVRLDKNYVQSENFRKKLFIPAIIGGIVAEYQRCTSRLDICKDRTTTMLALTPHLDVRLTPEAQFRVGLPLRRLRTAGKGITELSSLLSVGFTLASL